MPSAASPGLRLRCALARAVFPFAAWSRDLCAGALRPVAGFAGLFASIHMDIAAEQALASSGTVMSLSRAIASAYETWAALGGRVPAAPLRSALPLVRSGACSSRNARQTAAYFV